jgi:hypothetical protein
MTVCDCCKDSKNTPVGAYCFALTIGIMTDHSIPVDLCKRCYEAKAKVYLSRLVIALRENKELLIAENPK